jgi:hypothetical protein
MKPKLILCLFCFLVVAMLVSLVLGCRGIARLRQDHYPPFLAPGTTFTGDEKISHPSATVILFLDSKEGKIFVGYLIIAVPIVCGTLIFKSKWRFYGFAVLICCASLFCWIGVRIFLHAVYDSSPYFQ